MIGDWDVTPDSSRRERLGFDETVFCASKSVDQIGRIVAAALETQTSLLLTRLARDKFSELASRITAELDYDDISRTAILGKVPAGGEAPRVAIVSAGSSDVPVAREAARTLNYYGQAVHEIYDVGVAGLWRLLDRLDEFKEMPVVITVAGMEGALASGQWRHGTEQRPGELRPGPGGRKRGQRLRRRLRGVADIERNRPRVD